jgi:hypothetical protein
MDDLVERMVDAGAQAMWSASVGRDPLLWAYIGEAFKNQWRHRARACLSALAAAGYAVVPIEMTPEQARRSLAGHALADRVREANPAEFARWVEMRRATWRQLVAAMGEGE